MLYFFIHLHDHIWWSDWPFKVKRSAGELVWRIACARMGITDLEYIAKETL